MTRSLPNAIAYEDLIDDVEPLEAVAAARRAVADDALLHVGHHRQPQGRRLHPALHLPPHPPGLATVSITAADNVLPVVPMFHASAWGYPFSATFVGAKLTYPGPDLTPEGLVRLFDDEQVTFSAGVPTVWLGIQQYLAAHPEADTSSMRAFLCGGSAVPRSMIDWYWRNRGIRVLQGWGMTETNPVASMAILKPEMEDWDFERQLDVLETAGLPAARAPGEDRRRERRRASPRRGRLR